MSPEEPMSRDPDVTPTEHLHDGRREDHPSRGDDSPIPRPAPTLEDIRQEVGLARRVTAVENAVLQLRTDSKDRYKTLTEHQQTVHDAVKASSQARRRDSRWIVSALRSVTDEVAKLSSDYSAQARHEDGRIKTQTDEVKLAKARAEAAVIVANQAHGTAVDTKRSATGWRIAWSAMLVVGGMLGAAYGPQIQALLQAIAARITGAHP